MSNVERPMTDSFLPRFLEQIGPHFLELLERAVAFAVALIALAGGVTVWLVGAAAARGTGTGWGWCSARLSFLRLGQKLALRHTPDAADDEIDAKSGGDL